MNHRISRDTWGTRKIHHETAMYLLRLCADLKVLLDANQPLRADQSRLEEWAAHRKDLEACESPIIRYTQYRQAHEGEMPKHTALLLAANGLITELKLRNVGESVHEINWNDLENIEREVMRLDCRERVVFY